METLGPWETRAFITLVREIAVLIERGTLHADDFAEPIEPYSKTQADSYAAKLVPKVREHVVDSRCPATDALLDYALTRFPGSDSINDLVREVGG